MLILSRKIGEKVVIRNDIWVTVMEVNGKSVRIGIDAPKDVLILRAELDQLQDKAALADLSDEPVYSEISDRHGDEIVRHAPARTVRKRTSGGRLVKSGGFVKSR